MDSGVRVGAENSGGNAMSLRGQRACVSRQAQLRGGRQPWAENEGETSEDSGGKEGVSLLERHVEGAGLW